MLTDRENIYVRGILFTLYCRYEYGTETKQIFGSAYKGEYKETIPELHQELEARRNFEIMSNSDISASCSPKRWRYLVIERSQLQYLPKVTSTNLLLDLIRFAMPSSVDFQSVFVRAVDLLKQDPVFIQLSYCRGDVLALALKYTVASLSIILHYYISIDYNARKDLAENIWTGYEILLAILDTEPYSVAKALHEANRRVASSKDTSENRLEHFLEKRCRRTFDALVVSYYRDRNFALLEDLFLSNMDFVAVMSTFRSSKHLRPFLHEWLGPRTDLAASVLKGCLTNSYNIALTKRLKSDVVIVSFVPFPPNPKQSECAICLEPYHFDQELVLCLHCENTICKECGLRYTATCSFCRTRWSLGMVEK